MKNFFFTSLLLLMVFASKGTAQQMNVATYNIRIDVASDSGNRWAVRKNYVRDLIKYHQFDLVGVQEALPNQVDDLMEMLPQFEHYGKGRDDGKDKGEQSCIFFNKQKFSLLASGEFWLSETPDMPSKGWDATCCNRICTWTKLKMKQAGKTFFVFNTHFDHQGLAARQNSAILVLEKIKNIAGNFPVLLIGDFNGGRETEWYKTLEKAASLADARFRSKLVYENNGSFNGFGSTLGDKEVIDHIFTSKHFSVRSWALLTDSYFGKFPSDHFPVVAKVQLR